MYVCIYIYTHIYIHTISPRPYLTYRRYSDRDRVAVCRLATCRAAPCKTAPRRPGRQGRVSLSAALGRLDVVSSSALAVARRRQLHARLARRRVDAVPCGRLLTRRRTRTADMYVVAPMCRRAAQHDLTCSPIPYAYHTRKHEAMKCNMIRCEKYVMISFRMLS